MEYKKQGLNEQKTHRHSFDYSETTDDVYENLEDCNPKTKRKVLIVFDDMLADIEGN